MNEVVDLSFVDRLPELFARRQHYRDVVREFLRSHIERIQDDVDSAVDRTRDLIKAGGDPTEELNQLDEYAKGLELVAALLRREAEKAGVVPVQTQTEKDPT